MRWACYTCQRGGNRIERISFWETRAPGADLKLNATEAHFWLTSLDTADDQFVELLSLLAPDEHARAERYRADRDRRAYCVARGRLRILLAAYLQCGPRDIEFVYDSRGKPALSPEFSTVRNLQFNVSHSEGLAIYGVTAELNIGVDIERTRDNIAFIALAHRFFSVEETAAIQSQSAPDQLQAFYACWTRKEAFVKATGHGLTRNLKSFSVSVFPGEPAALLRDDDPQTDRAHCILADLVVPEGYAAAAAMDASVTVGRGFHWGPIMA